MTPILMAILERAHTVDEPMSLPWFESPMLYDYDIC